MTSQSSYRASDIIIIIIEASVEHRQIQIISEAPIEPHKVIIIYEA